MMNGSDSSDSILSKLNAVRDPDSLKAVLHQVCRAQIKRNHERIATAIDDAIHRVLNGGNNFPDANLRAQALDNLSQQQS